MVIDNTAQNSTRVTDLQTEDSRLLDRLNPVNALSYYEGRSCMKDTRKSILDHIVAWAEPPLENSNESNGSTRHNMFWLYGSPGLGKTSIANSLCQRLHATGNLGGSFFCRRDDPVLCDPNRVMPTLLYRLAWMWNPFRDLVVQALREDPNLNPDWTGCALLLKHLYSLDDRPQTALVLVIDALDESGEPQPRARLLKCLAELCTRVNWLKIVVTSRPEHDISSFFQTLEPMRQDLSKDTQAHQDIRNFARYRMDLLANQYHLPNDWPGESRLEQIVTRSGGLFIFVETLYQFLDDPNAELLLNEVLSGMLGEANSELHKLYSTAIATRIGRRVGDFRLFVHALVAVATHRSLPDKSLASLIGLDPGVISSWVDGLSSLLYRDMSENGGIRARHLSVIEFLTGPTCPLEFRVDLQDANAELGNRCLITMTNELEFNICKLETSCVLNADIPNLHDRVQEKISDALQYSCRHWSSHLCSGSSPPSKQVSELLGAFLAGVQLLYWLEVLSVTGKVPMAISALRLMKAHFKVCIFTPYIDRD
jgi:NACHT domain